MSLGPGGTREQEYDVIVAQHHATFCSHQLPAHLPGRQRLRRRVRPPQGQAPPRDRPPPPRQHRLRGGLELSRLLAPAQRGQQGALGHACHRRLQRTRTDRPCLAAPRACGDGRCLLVNIRLLIPMPLHSPACDTALPGLLPPSGSPLPPSRPSAPSFPPSLSHSTAMSPSAHPPSNPTAISGARGPPTACFPAASRQARARVPGARACCRQTSSAALRQRPSRRGKRGWAESSAPRSTAAREGAGAARANSVNESADLEGRTRVHA